MIKPSATKHSAHDGTHIQTTIREQTHVAKHALMAALHNLNIVPDRKRVETGCLHSSFKVSIAPPSSVLLE